jgi:hypothetical protein
VQRVQDLISNPGTEIQARSLILAVETFVVGGGVYVAGLLAIILEAIYIKQQPIPAYIHLPADQISQGYNAAGATVTVVSIDTLVEFTITAQPTPTGLTG